MLTNCNTAKLIAGTILYIIVQSALEY